MVLQLDQAEDPRAKLLEPERFEGGGLWDDLRFVKNDCCRGT